MPRRTSRGVTALSLRIAGLGALATVFWLWRFLAPAPTTGPIQFSVASDLYTQYLPVLTAAAGDFAAGRFPSWNPYQLAGTPMLPTRFEFGALYPLNALYFALPAHLALGWTTSLHLVLAGLGMYALAAACGVSAAAAWFAAIAFMLSRSLMFWPNLFHAEALAPAVLAAWLRLAAAPRPRTTVIAGVLLALQVSTGGLQIVAYTLYALALLLPTLAWEQSRAGMRKRVAVASGIAVLLGIGLTAALLLPTISASALTDRHPGGLTLEETLPFPTPTLGALLQELVSPAPGLPRIFFGWTTLVLAGVGAMFFGRRRIAVGLLLVMLLGAALVLGPHTPFYSLYYRLPSGSWFRLPQRAALLIGIGVIGLAAGGVDIVRRRRPHLAWLISLAVATELFHATWSTAPHPQARLSPPMDPPPIAEQLRQRLGTDRALVAINWQDRFPFTQKLGTWCRLPVAEDYDQLAPAAYGAFLRALLGPSALVDSTFAGRYHPRFGSSTARRAIDLLSVRWLVIAPGAQLVWEGTTREAPAGGPPVLTENPDALPRVFIVHRVEPAANREEALSTIAGSQFDPHTTAVAVGDRRLDGSGSSEADRVQLAAADDVLVLRAHLDEPGLLVVSDVLLPGWSATVDATPVPIVATNAIFRGVFLDPGEHVVRFEYRCPGLRWGLALSAASLVAIIALLLLDDPREFERIVRRFPAAANSSEAWADRGV